MSCRCLAVSCGVLWVSCGVLRCLGGCLAGVLRVPCGVLRCLAVISLTHIVQHFINCCRDGDHSTKHLKCATLLIH